jgi:hypothetical protein
MDYLVGLACSRDTWQLDKFLLDRLEASSDFNSDLENIVTKSTNYLFAWHFLKNNWLNIYVK